MQVRKFEKVCEILDSFGKEKSKLIPILQAVQKEYKYLPEEILAFIATSLGVPPAKVFGVASFYAHFTLTPKGKYVIKLCDGTACHVKGSINLLDVLREYLKLPIQQHTTTDMMFTIETVSCLGACGLAPVMMVNDDVYGQLTPQSAVKVIESIVVKEAENGKTE